MVEEGATISLSLPHFLTHRSPASVAPTVTGKVTRDFLGDRPMHNCQSSPYLSLQKYLIYLTPGQFSLSLVSGLRPECTSPKTRGQVHWAFLTRHSVNVSLWPILCRTLVLNPLLKSDALLGWFQTHFSSWAVSYISLIILPGGFQAPLLPAETFPAAPHAK